MNNQTYNKLKGLHLSGMAECYQDMLLDRKGPSLAAEELVMLMVDREEDRRSSGKRQRLIAKANFEQIHASFANLDYDESRMLDRQVMLRLESCDYIHQSHNVVVMGATGSGKSYLACAIGMSACLRLYSVRFTRMKALLDDYKIASELKQKRLLKELKACNLLIIDDWMLSDINEKETQFFYDLIHDRDLSPSTSTVLCTQYDLKDCAFKMEGKTLSDAIYDRLKHNAYVINLSQNEKFGSMRARYGKNNKPL